MAKMNYIVVLVQTFIFINIVRKLLKLHYTSTATNNKIGDNARAEYF